MVDYAAGGYDKRIWIQSKTETQSDSGNVTETWSNLYNVAAKFEPLGSREFPIDQKRYAETTARFRIRYRPGITERHRIVYGGQTWNLSKPLVLGRNVELQIEASEIS